MYVTQKTGARALVVSIWPNLMWAAVRIPPRQFLYFNKWRALSPNPTSIQIIQKSFYQIITNTLLIYQLKIIIIGEGMAPGENE